MTRATITPAPRRRRRRVKRPSYSARPVMIPCRPAMAASARTSSSVADAAAGDHRHVGGGDGGRQPVDVGPAEQAVAVDVGDHERRRRREPAERVGELHAARLGPAVHGDVAAAVVEPDGDRHDRRRRRRRAPGRAPRPTPSRRGRRRRRRAPRRRRRERTPPPVCTAARPATAAAIAATTGRFVASPVRAASRSTTWIHVAPCGAEVGGHGDGVVAVDGLGRVVALAQAHDVAAAQVDRRVQQRSRAATASELTKLPSRPSPADADFSGWNCTANTLPARNAALTGPP